MTTRERAAYVAFWLSEGRELTTAYVAQQCGITQDGALKLLKAISRVIPIYETNGIWCKLAD